ncbi:alpha/beta hydrolase [Actinoplanes sp. NPDC051851]|uniref:alpha/beta hydrolase n=1 Tax=Actinoplanes sp. NPDC051851 TaxID=3154753 RepID=UPI0034359728
MDREQQRAVIREALAGTPRTKKTEAEERRLFAMFSASMPLDPSLTTEDVTLGGRPAVRLSAGEPQAGPTLLYLHGGGFVVGSGRTGARLAGALIARSGGVAYSLDYRLAPEHPFPAASRDALAAYRELIGRGEVLVAGDSAGGGLVISLLIAARDAGLPQPAAAVVFSPWVDLTLSGDSLRTRDGVDPLFEPASLRWYAERYAPGAELAASPLFADLTGLAPLLVQVGDEELLLDDAVRLAERATAAGVAVTLEVGAGLPHVYQHHFGRLDDAVDALDRAAAFLTRARAGA